MKTQTGFLFAGWDAEREERMAEMKAIQNKMETNQAKMDTSPVKADANLKAACLEVPKEDAIVKLVVGMRKQDRDWNLTMEHHQKPKERTEGYCASRKRVTVGGRRMTRFTRAALRKRRVRKDHHGVD